MINNLLKVVGVAENGASPSSSPANNHHDAYASPGG
eukprot:CAMPEP_0172564924 /NCGR_PEP_ID=MMETSP1067-20121228/106240_1 /TAXON_ID=265564 ORGANISM="Thalassiosira punctigera, Strain Tpunct2005C2" /NCGR_SAMPLE_ID=MMETSP1067 /ASSEMBLY_ACC=CAM_ASM_000444 /LENGTH=35 /DNA_ID= /DNA_START= /DNA_END= /DNA_ORIENTATION=